MLLHCIQPSRGKITRPRLDPYAIQICQPFFFPTQRRCPAVVLWTVWNFHLRGQRLLSGSGCISNWNRFDRSRKPGVLSPWTASGPPGTGRERILARNNNTLRRGDLPVWMWKRAHCDTAPKRVLFAPGVGSFAYQRCEVGAFGPSENVSGHYRWRSSGQNLWDFLPLIVGWVWPRFYWNFVLNIWNFFLLKVCKRWVNLGLDVWSLYFNLRLKFYTYMTVYNWCIWLVLTYSYSLKSLTDYRLE